MNRNHEIIAALLLLYVSATALVAGVFWLAWAVELAKAGG